MYVLISYVFAITKTLASISTYVIMAFKTIYEYLPKFYLLT